MPFCLLQTALECWAIQLTRLNAYWESHSGPHALLGHHQGPQQHLQACLRPSLSLRDSPRRCWAFKTASTQSGTVVQPSMHRWATIRAGIGIGLPEAIPHCLAKPQKMVGCPARLYEYCHLSPICAGGPSGWALAYACLRPSLSARDSPRTCWAICSSPIPLQSASAWRARRA